MKYSSEYLEAIRKILNETRQDRLCRPFLAKRPQAEILPFLGSASPAYFFLGVNPSGYDVSGAPTQAEDYIEYATAYFDNPKSDKASFTGYLPYTANHSNDYSAFGQAACVTHLVPILTARSSEVTAALARACWPRSRRLVESLKPNLILVHGSLAWKFLTGQEEDSTILMDVPEAQRQGIPEIYEKLEADKLPFQTRFEGISEEYKPWVVALPHLGGTGGGKEVRKKAEQAVQIARRRLSGGPVTVTGGARIRVRRPD
jgi:hypothetical protein